MGLPAPNDGTHPIMDGQIHRLPVDGDRGKEATGSYRAFDDGVPNGWHQNFRTTDKPVVWKHVSGQRRETIPAAVIAAKSIQDEAERAQKAEQAAARAIVLLLAASPAGDHPYLTRKQIAFRDDLFVAGGGSAVETRDGKMMNIAGRLLVPIRAAGGAVISLQIIDDTGGKMFLPGGKISGGQHVIGKLDSPWPLWIAEGYATADAIHQATGHTVVVTFTAHNLAAIAAQMRAAYPDHSILTAGDNDHHLPLQLDPAGKPKRNIGIESAKAAAAAIDGHAVIPEAIEGARGTDWWDVMHTKGMSAMQTELAAGQATGARAKIARDIATDRGYGRANEVARGREAGGCSR
jgi:putative DNA primase/helicase